MKRLLSILTCLLMLLSGKSQVIQFRDLTYNDIFFRHNTDGSLFENSAAGRTGCRIPASGTSTSIFAANLWLGGLLPNGDTATLIGTYNNMGLEYVPGPASNSYDQQYFAMYYKTWIMSSDQVKYHRDHYKDAGYHMDTVIREWPGNGREAEEKSLMAPYVDVNENYRYDPENGDYPAVPGDMNLFYMRNSLTNQSANTTGGQKLKLQVNGFLYAFKSTSSPLNTTLFHKVLIINAGSQLISDFHAGMWVDIDLGDNLDDLGGTIPDKNAVYCYNADNFDTFGKAPYGQNPPVQGFTWLNQKMSSGKIYFYPNEPEKDYAKYYYYLTGKTINGADSSLYDYPGNPVTLDSTSEYGLGHTGEDLRFVNSVSLGDFLPGNVFCLDGAYIWSRGGDDFLDNVSSFYQDLNEVQDFYQTTLHGQCQRYASGITTQESQQKPLLYPNPAQNRLLITNTDSEATEIRLYDPSGRIVLHTTFAEEIDLSHIPAGMYTITILNREGKPVHTQLLARTTY